ncbi:hypothetical protein Tco_0303139 [Tanacetum coccineum]
MHLWCFGILERTTQVLLCFFKRYAIKRRCIFHKKKINVTKPDTTRLDLRKRHPYTPYKEPQGFIYVDDHKRNKLMRSDELYKFSDGTLTRLLSSLEDITKNIDMEYLAKRRCSNLEKKRAHFMIKDINKLLKERRMMRSLEKFIGEHAEFDESDTYVLERFDTPAGNIVKKILLKLNLSDHRLILIDLKIGDGRLPDFSRLKDSYALQQSVKVKELQEKRHYKGFSRLSIQRKGLMCQHAELAAATSRSGLAIPGYTLR